MKHYGEVVIAAMKTTTWQVIPVVQAPAPATVTCGDVGLCSD